MIRIRFDSGEVVECREGVAVGEFLSSQYTGRYPCLGALVNNDVVSLSYPLTVNSHLRFLDASDAHGWRIYRRSVSFLLAMAVRDVFPQAVFSVDHSLGPGLYCSFREHKKAKDGISESHVAAIEERMRAIVAADLRIERRKVAYADAVKTFEELGEYDKLHLLRYRNPPHVVTHWCDGFSDLAHGPLAPRTGLLGTFALVHCAPGLVLHLAERKDPEMVPPFEPQPHLLRIFHEHKGWGRILGVDTVGKLNEHIATNRIGEFIKIAEALHEKKVAEIAGDIARHRDRIRVVLIAGPSSSGKTTFAKRLAVQMTVNGLRPHTVSMDDYFVGPESNPVDENGEPDFEHIDAVDLELLNRHLLRLTAGDPVELPRYNFETKRREPSDVTLQLGGDDILILEGIHGLNPRTTQMVPRERTFRIYISALTQLNLDTNNRISTTDNRLMRRIVRDSQFRGHSAIETLRMWPSVRRGEKRWIFPFQGEADATFNSALDYELAVLKSRVEPLLMEVKPSDVDYAEARRLTEFLLNFLPAPSRAVPPNSILREYIGGSSFTYA